MLSCPVNAYVVLLLVDVRRVAAVYALGGRATTDTCGCPTGALLRAASGSDKSAAAAAARRTAAFAAPHPYAYLGLGLQHWHVTAVQLIHTVRQRCSTLLAPPQRLAVVNHPLLRLITKKGTITESRGWDVHAKKQIWSSSTL